MTVALARRAAWLAAAGLCLVYVYSGIDELLDFRGAVAVQAHFGLAMPAVCAAAAIAVQLGGSILVLFGRGRAVALGAVALAGFTLAATFIGHPFWREAGAERFADLNSFLEHFGLVGGFMLIALRAVPASA